MSNYTVITDWDGKDALADSNPAKVISGDEFQDEFDAISTAVATKADINGDATEAFSCSTPASGSDTTVAATTAWVNDAIDAIPSSYPVGSIFLTVTDYADSDAVVAAIGGTTWVRFAEGRMLVGYKSTDTDFDTAEETGGAKTHTLTTAELPSHTHEYGVQPIDNGSQAPEINGYSGTNYDACEYDDSWGGSTNVKGAYTTATGSGDAHSIMNPYIVTYMWKRTA